MKLKVLPLVIATTMLAGSPFAFSATPDVRAIDVRAMPLVRTIDARFQSFQIGMSHLTGGETWRYPGWAMAPVPTEAGATFADSRR